jgi:uncharacterized membrane protein
MSESREVQIIKELFAYQDKETKVNRQYAISCGLFAGSLVTALIIRFLDFPWWAYPTGAFIILLIDIYKMKRF